MPLCDVISYREFTTRFRVIEDYLRTESPTNRGKENYTTCAYLSVQIFCLKIVKIIYIPSCLIETSLGYSIFAVYAIKHREQLWYKTGRRLIKYVRTEVVWFNFRIAHYWYGAGKNYSKTAYDPDSDNNPNGVKLEPGIKIRKNS